LVAVEPTSLAMVHCGKTGDRSAAAWQAALTPFDQLECVLSDAARGIAAGVQAVNATRQAKNPQATPVVHGLDVFHTAMEAQQVLRRHWRQAEAIWQEAEEAEAAAKQAKQRGQDSRQHTGKASLAWRRAEQALGEVERLEAAWQRARGALRIFRADGTLNERRWAEAEITAAVAELSGIEWRKTRNFLRDPRTLAFLDRMHLRLAQAVPDESLRKMGIRRWWLRQSKAPVAPAATPVGQMLQLLDAVVRDGALTPQEQAAYERVAVVLKTTVRASSAVEGINSVLRMQQSRHRQVTQTMLDLKRLYWNCRKLPTGHRRKRSPYEILGIPLPAKDFWTLVQSGPDKTTELVSSS
jgi:hypothetical protein